MSPYEVTKHPRWDVLLSNSSYNAIRKVRRELVTAFFIIDKALFQFIWLAQTDAGVSLVKDVIGMEDVN